jgi:hypothetical protein
MAETFKKPVACYTGKEQVGLVSADTVDNIEQAFTRSSTKSIL